MKSIHSCHFFRFAHFAPTPSFFVVITRHHPFTKIDLQSLISTQGRESIVFGEKVSNFASFGPLIAFCVYTQQNEKTKISPTSMKTERK